MLNAVLARAQRGCCAAMDTMVPTLASVLAFEQRLVDMFRHEWQLAGYTRPLMSIAIVDSAPEQQYLYPEFLHFQKLFERHGLQAVIADPAELQWRDGALWHGEQAVDLVYNHRGDKLTKRVWQEILQGGYVAQAIVTPGERMVDGQDQAQAMKFDLRAYAYDGAVQWVAARLYQGQTTNFRTPGGGFAPVYSTVDASAGLSGVAGRG